MLRERVCKGVKVLDHKTTGDLQTELMNTADLDRFLKENNETFNGQEMHEYLEQIFEDKKMTKAALSKRSCMSNVYLHQVFSGRRNPSRNRLLCICFGMEATLEQTQELLKRGGMGLLYPKNRRDAIISYGLLHTQTLEEVNDKLFCEDEETLY